MIADSQGKLAQQISIQMNSMRLAGIVLNNISNGPDMVPVLEQLDAPIVCLDQRIKGRADHVCCDNRLATEILTEHLLQLGHRASRFSAATEKSIWRGNAKSASAAS